MTTTIDARFVATRALFDRARARVTRDDIERYAPSDPGYHDYVAAFTQILERGHTAIENTFDVTETIGLTRWTNARADEPRFRWFRILTSSTDLLLDKEWPHYDLATLLVDSFALSRAGDADAPLDLLAAASREVRAASPPEPEHAFTWLAELILSATNQLAAPAIEALCHELDDCTRLWWERGDVPQPESELLWGLTYFDQLHSVWLDLIAARFPVEPPAAAELKARLLAAGAPWLRQDRAPS